MATYHAYKLIPRAPFHFGMRGVGLESTGLICPSDTLFSALCLAWREVHGAGGKQGLKAFLERFPGVAGAVQPPLRLTSALPYAGPILLFSKPLRRINLEGKQDEPSTAKRVKKLQFVSRGIFEAILADRPLGGEWSDENRLPGGVWMSGGERKLLQDALTDGKDNKPTLWIKHNVPRVTVNRRASVSEVYQAERVYFRQGCGLYFLVEWLDDRWRLLFEDALRVLGDEGIGGERSAGHGLFTAEIPDEANFTLGTPEPEIGFFTTLSLYHPATLQETQTVLGGKAAYQLVPRRGWIASPEGSSFRRPPVRMLGEGALLHGSAQGHYGDLVNLTPRDLPRGVSIHPVYRYGLAFPVPIVPPKEERKP